MTDSGEQIWQRLRSIRDTLADARPTDAHLLAMTAVEGFTIREAADVLGLSESAAKMRLSPAAQPDPQHCHHRSAPRGRVMMTEFTPDRSEAIETALVRYVAVHPHRRTRWARTVRLLVIPTAPGCITSGTDPGGNNPGASWAEGEIGHDSSTWYDFPLDQSAETLYFRSHELTAVVTIQYLAHVPTRFGINAAGETFGAGGGEQGEPDLIAAMATNQREGYIRAADLAEAEGPVPSSPEEAARQSIERAGTSVTLPVYESDGTTRIGDFVIGR